MAGTKASCYNHYLQRADTWFAMNCRTQAVLELSGATYKALISNDCSAIAPEEVALLREQGLLVAAEDNELRQVIEANRRIRMQPSLAGVCITPTMACNFSCSYCYQGDTLATHEHAIALHTLQKGLDIYLSQLCTRYPTIKRLQVNWYGGEPLLCVDRVLDLSEWLKTHAAGWGVSLELSMVTNGYLLEKNLVGQMARLDWSWLQITLDGAREVHDRRRRHRTTGDTFNHLLSRIAYFQDFPNIGISLRVHVDQLNAPTIPVMLEQLANTGLDKLKNLSLYFAPVRSNARMCPMDALCVFSVSTFGSVESELLKVAAAVGFRTATKPRSRIAGCSANSPAVIVVDPQGNVHKCVGSLGDQALAVGALTEQGLHITNPTINSAWLNWSLGERCRSCNVLPLCMGGCSMQDVLGVDNRYGSILQVAGDERCTPWRNNMGMLLATYVDKLLQHDLRRRDSEK